ncbi:MAG TPA: hypothetical protein VLE44_01265 [Candidatus Saccharimonadales bacterium]|nr:hypothetical protein [Candidatus Saccharimonadales bacterium]
MSPEYNNINNVCKVVRRELKERMGEFGLSYETLVHTGFGFNMNGKLGSIVPLECLTEGQKKDAKRESSTWHVVNGIDDSGIKPHFFPDSGKLSSHHAKKYRGNHRSHTRGVGQKAMFREIKKELKYNEK